jgi:hypothetical protein
MMLFANYLGKKRSGCQKNILDFVSFKFILKVGVEELTVNT